jgi:ABC-type nitrate/sulfonate/bicarbonate transport system substrate-binding protein
MTAHRKVRLGCFYRSLPMMAADQHGFYREGGIEVDYQQVTSSTQQFEYLRDDRYDVVQTSPDNVANYRYNDRNPIGTRVDAQGFMGMDYGMLLAVVARPGIATIEQLRGRTVSVDAPASGFAYVLYEILARHGLRRGEDYTIVETGGVFDRYRHLIETDEFDATLLSGGFETRARNAGYTLLDSVHDIADPYLGVWAAAKSSWLRENVDLVGALVAAYRAATRWCFDPANREACLELLMQAPQTTRSLAEQLYEIQLRPGVGNVPDAGIDPAAVLNVLRLREQFGGFEDPPDIAAIARTDGDLYDLSYLRRAIAMNP